MRPASPVSTAHTWRALLHRRELGARSSWSSSRGHGPWAEYIDPQKFGITVALNRRLIVDVFELEEPALAWLGSHAPPFHACTIVAESLG